MRSGGCGEWVERNDGWGGGIKTTGDAGVLCAHFHAGHVFHPDDATIRRFADDHVAKLFRRFQASLSKHRISELLVFWSWFTSDLTCGVDCVLRLDRVRNVRNGDAQFCQLIRLDP